MSTLNVALVQTDIQWCDRTTNLTRLSALLAACTDVDLILLPETFSTGFAISDHSIRVDESGEDVLAWMKAMSEKLDAVIAGSVLVHQGDKAANRFFWVWPNGEVKFYDKRHLFRLGNEGDFVVAGSNRTILTVKGVRILPLVCYDLRFPVWSRNCNDYDVIVNVANWPAARRHIWDTLLKARAMENQSFVLGVNRVGEDGNGVAHNGGTAGYDFVGEPLKVAPDNQTAICTLSLDLQALAQFKTAFPAFLDADVFTIEDQQAG